MNLEADERGLLFAAHRGGRPRRSVRDWGVRFRLTTESRKLPGIEAGPEQKPNSQGDPYRRRGKKVSRLVGGVRRKKSRV